MADLPIPRDGNLTQSRLKDLLHYDPLTGLFTWRIALSRRTRIGSVAGCRNGEDEHIRIRISGRNYYAHRMAWLYVTGAWPPLEIDHADGIRCNNRWANLRLASSSQNNANRRTASSGALGLKGVRYDARDGRWQARIQVSGKRISLGRYASAEAAQAAYSVAAREYFGLYACTP